MTGQTELQTRKIKELMKASRVLPDFYRNAVAPGVVPAHLPRELPPMREGAGPVQGPVFGFLVLSSVENLRF